MVAVVDSRRESGKTRPLGQELATLEQLAEQGNAVRIETEVRGEPGQSRHQKRDRQYEAYPVCPLPRLGRETVPSCDDETASRPSRGRSEEHTSELQSQ